MNSNHNQDKPVLTWDGWLRLCTIGYFLGGIAAVWTLWCKESLFPGDITPTMTIFWCLFLSPALWIGLGIWRWRQGRYRLLGHHIEKPAGQHGTSVGLALGVFAAWTCTYYASGLVVSSQTMLTLDTSWDQAIPLIPETTFIYITVQWFCVLALALAGDALPWPRVAAAYGTNIIVCTLCFLCIPVTMHHIQVPVTDLSTWALSLLRTADLANNCFPSSHCAMALLSAFLLRRVSRLWGWLGLASALAIGLTTLTTKQHYIADVIVGYALACVSYVIWWRQAPSTPDKAPTQEAK